MHHLADRVDELQGVTEDTHFERHTSQVPNILTVRNIDNRRNVAFE
jgi:hypothetical protein